MIPPYHCVTLYLAGDLDLLDEAFEKMPLDIVEIDATDDQPEPWNIKWEHDVTGQSPGIDLCMTREIPPLDKLVIGYFRTVALHGDRLALTFYSWPDDTAAIFWHYIDPLVSWLKRKRILGYDTPTLGDLVPGWYRLRNGTFILSYIRDIPVMDVQSTTDFQALQACISNFADDWFLAEQRLRSATNPVLVNMPIAHYRLSPNGDRQWTIERTVPSSLWQEIGSVDLAPDGKYIRLRSADLTQWLAAQPFVTALLDYLVFHGVVDPVVSIPQSGAEEITPQVELPPCKNRDRKQKVLKMKLDYMTNEKIADDLRTTLGTVKNDIHWLRTHKYLPG